MHRVGGRDCGQVVGWLETRGGQVVMAQGGGDL